MENIKFNNIDESHKVQYLNETNKNILEIAKNINSYVNNNNNNIFNILDEKKIENIIIKTNSNNNIKNDKGLSLFEKMNIMEENDRIIETFSKEMNNINDDSIINLYIILSNMNKIKLNWNEKNIYHNLNEFHKEIKLNYLCQIHNKKFTSYCFNCNKNICENCIDNGEIHKAHNISNYSKLILNKFHEEEFKGGLYASHLALFKLKEIVIEVCSNLLDKNEIVLKNKVKRAYIKYYKKNLYQIQYAKLIFIRYILQKEISLINYQVISNFYDIKFNNVIFPETNSEIKEKAIILIDFLSKRENYFLLQTDSSISDIIFDPKINNDLYVNYSNKKNLINNNIINTIENNNENFINKNIENKIHFEHDNIASDILKGNINKQKIIKETINQTKITTTTSIFLSNSSLKTDFKNIGKKKEKMLKKITKKIITNRQYNKTEKYKETGDELSYEYLNFIEENPPLKDGIEVQFYKELKFVYKDKENNKIIYSIYQGECQKGTQIRHGRGFFKWGDGEKYIGYWVNNKREGKGTNYYCNGNSYRGMFKNGKKEGRGRYEWKNGDVYEGEWKNGMKEGQGIYCYSNGDYYKGPFANDKINGKGIYIWKNQAQYSGDFKDNYINGEGLLYRNKKGEKDNKSREVFKVNSYDKMLIECNKINI